MADRIVVMRDGRISQIGAPLELYDHPANVFVAGFIGSPAMNLLNGEVAADGSFTGDGVSFPLETRLPAGRKITYGIRPEHLVLADTGQAAQVVVVEPTGAEIHLVLRAGGQEMTAVLRERQTFQPGQVVHLRPLAGAAHLFDGDSGERL